MGFVCGEGMMSDWENDVLVVDVCLDDALETLKSIDRIYKDQIHNFPDGKLLPDTLWTPTNRIYVILEDLKFLKEFIKPEVEKAIESLGEWSDMEDGASY
jgi:hypothetical protein